MASDNWYRNTHWDAEIEAAFNAKLARSRSQKAQYLQIQGSILKDRDPPAAIRLLQRCIEEGDDFHIAHAWLDMAHAHYVLGEVDAALERLEAAVAQQEHYRLVRTTAAYDFAFLVALHERAERYDRALKLVGAEGEGFFAAMVFEAEVAKALIFASLGQEAEAQDAARKALEASATRVGWVPGHPDVGVVPEVEAPLFERLRAIAA